MGSDLIERAVRHAWETEVPEGMEGHTPEFYEAFARAAVEFYAREHPAVEWLRMAVDMMRACNGWRMDSADEMADQIDSFLRGLAPEGEPYGERSDPRNVDEEGVWCVSCGGCKREKHSLPCTCGTVAVRDAPCSCEDGGSYKRGVCQGCGGYYAPEGEREVRCGACLDLAHEHVEGCPSCAPAPAEPRLGHCPGCGKPTGHDRCLPPNSYYCCACASTTEPAPEEDEAVREAVRSEYDRLMAEMRERSPRERVMDVLELGERCFVAGVRAVINAGRAGKGE